MAFVDAVETDPDVELHSLMLLRHGHVVAEAWWAPHTADRARLVYSISKSFTTTALAFALAEGLLDLDDTVVSHFPEFEAEITDPLSRAITVRHLASMSSGHTQDMLEPALAIDQHEPIRGFLLSPPAKPPGTVFAYSQPCTYAIASIIQRAAGEPLTTYLRPRLFDPLGIGEVGWLTAPPGREQGFSGLFARTEDIAKLGQLYLQKGRWGDAQLISPDYVTQATSLQVANPEMENPDWRQGYGFQFWMAQHGYRGDGAFGQFCVVLPEHDTVLAMTGGTEAMQAVLTAAWEHLLPGLVDARPDDRAQSALSDKLVSLTLTPGSGEPEPADWTPWDGLSLPVEQAALGVGASRFTAVDLARGGQGLQVTLREDDNAITFAVGAPEWTVAEPRDRHDQVVPVAASGGWQSDETLRVEVIFLETPHRLVVTASAASGTASVAWRHPPLDGGRLRTLHRPRGRGPAVDNVQDRVGPRAAQR